MVLPSVIISIVLAKKINRKECRERREKIKIKKLGGLCGLSGEKPK